MIDAFKEAYTELNQLTNGILFSVIMIFPISLGLRVVLMIVECLCKGERTVYIEKQSEPTRAEPPTVNLKKGEVDSDMEKYFNYDVHR